MFAAMMTLLIAANVAANPATPAPEKIALYDLTYALKHDPNQRQQVENSWDHVHAVATLQGNVNRAGPRLYLRYIEDHGRNCDDHWLKYMSRPGAWLDGCSIETVPTLEALVKRFRDDIKGVVLYDPNVDATSNLASTIAGVENLIAVRYDPAPETVYTRLVVDGPKLPVQHRLLNEDGSSMFTGTGTIPGTDRPSTGSAKADAYLWLKQHYVDTGKVTARYVGYYPDAYWINVPEARKPFGHSLSNHDFFIAERACFVDLNVWQDEACVDDPNQKPGTDVRVFKEILLSLYKQGGKDHMIHVGGFPQWEFKYTTFGQSGGKYDPVPTEWQFVKVLSAYNAFCDADAGHLGGMANASFNRHYPLKDRYPQSWVTHDELKARGLLTENGRVNFEGRDFFLFYAGDWDAAGWLYQLTPSYWDHPDRGTLPLMWAISPILAVRTPMIMDYIWTTASPNDYFVAADNGAGYLNPGMLQEPRPISGLPCGLDAWAKHCIPHYRKWGQTVTGFIIDGYAPGMNTKGYDAYAKFSPNGIMPCLCPPAMLHKDMPILKADYDLGDHADKAAEIIVKRIEARYLPFHRFRAVLKTPDWYQQVYDMARAKNPKITLLDAPSFCELLRVYLRNHPDAASGNIPLLKGKE